MMVVPGSPYVHGMQQVGGGGKRERGGGKGRGEKRKRVF